MRFTAADLVAALTARNLHGDYARLVGPDVEIDGVSFDSRDVRPGQMFVPIVAERDGHDFIGQALAAGAVAYLTSRDDSHDRFGATGIRVRDTAEALIDTGGWVRTLFPASTVVIGVTGSVGKTSTKDLIAVSNGAACSSHAYERSHVLEAMRLESWRLGGAIRFSFSHESSFPDAEALARIIESVRF